MDAFPSQKVTSYFVCTLGRIMVKFGIHRRSVLRIHSTEIAVKFTIVLKITTKLFKISNFSRVPESYSNSSLKGKEPILSFEFPLFFARSQSLSPSAILLRFSDSFRTPSLIHSVLKTHTRKSLKGSRIPAHSS